MMPQARLTGMATLRFAEYRPYMRSECANRNHFLLFTPPGQTGLIRMHFMLKRIVEHSIVNPAQQTLAATAGLAWGIVALALVVPSVALGRDDAKPQQANQGGAQLQKAAESSAKPIVNAPLKDYPFFTFCIDWHDSKKRGFVEQAAMLKELGYEGVGHIFLDGVADRIKSLDDAGLKLYQITMNVDMAPGKKPYDAKEVQIVILAYTCHRLGTDALGSDKEDL